MFHEKDKYYINGSSDDFRIIGTEKDQHLIRLRERVVRNVVTCTDLNLGQKFQENKILKLLNFEFCLSFKSAPG